MRAVTSDFEGPETLTFSDVPAPSPGPEELLVEVKATALNRADLLQTMGMYPAPAGVPAEIPGLEYAGVVKAVGARVQRWKVGDRVMGLVAGGAWAEQLLTHEREAMAIPSALSFAQAAAIPEAFSTAFDALVTQAGLRLGQHVLIHAVASGVGTAALQLCALYGAHALGTGRNDAKLARARALGLHDAVLVTESGEFAKQIKALTSGRGADVVLDLVGGGWFEESLKAMAPGATLMQIGLVAGARAEIPLQLVLSKRLRLIGTTLRSRPLEEKIAVARAVEAALLPAFERGALRPVIDAILPMAELAPALARLAKNDTFGKLVLTW